MIKVIDDCWKPNIQQPIHLKGRPKLAILPLIFCIALPPCQKLDIILVKGESEDEGH